MKTFDKSAKGPLDGIRILDLSRLVAGNMATHVLADFGADVIKVERPGRGDDLRYWRVADQEAFWKVYCRNKRSMELDIKSEHGQDVLLKLVRSSHALVENFVPGTLERMGLAPERLQEENPQLSVLRVSGWGQTGPFRERPGFGTLVEAMSGYAYLNGSADGPPTLPPLALADMVAGLYGASSLMIALRSVEISGLGGQIIDLSLFEPIFSLVSSEAVKYRLTGEVTMRSGNETAHTAPRNVYTCADGRFLALSGSMQSMTEKIFDTIGRPELKNDPRFRTNDDRVRNREELDETLGAFISGYSQEENLRLFEQANVTVGPVLSVADLMSHPFAGQREAVVEVEDREFGSIPMHGHIPRLGATPAVWKRPAPRLGEHTAEILAEVGMASEYGGQA